MPQYPAQAAAVWIRVLCKGTNLPALPWRDPQQDPWVGLPLAGELGMLCWAWDSLWGFTGDPEVRRGAVAAVGVAVFTAGD